jgi:hypothetical protein
MVVPVVRPEFRVAVFKPNNALGLLARHRISHLNLVIHSPHSLKAEQFSLQDLFQVEGGHLPSYYENITYAVKFQTVADPAELRLKGDTIAGTIGSI